MSEKTDLKNILKELNPGMNQGEYVFITTNNIATIPRELPICEFKESEGTTVVLRRDNADRLNLPYQYIAAWITLTVHSSLHAVGLTALVSSELAENNISCNMIAACHHDHIFVDIKDAQKAMEVLKDLSERYR